MQVETFKLFSDLVETGSFSIAAERNGITQSAVSQRIKALEDYYDVLLIERGRKNFAVTGEGDVFLKTAQDIIVLHDGLRTSLHELRDRVDGELKVSTVYSIGFHELPPLLDAYRKRFPHVEPILQYRRANQVYGDVLTSNADLGLVAYPQSRKGVAVDIVWKEKLVIICPPAHELEKQKSITLKELNRQRFISFEPDLPTRQAFDAMLKGVKVKEMMEFNNVDAVKRGVLSENAISIVPQDSVSTEVQSGELCQIDIAENNVWRPIGIIRRRTKAITPAMREFIKHLKETSEGKSS